MDECCAKSKNVLTHFGVVLDAGPARTSGFESKSEFFKLDWSGMSLDRM